MRLAVTAALVLAAAAALGACSTARDLEQSAEIGQCEKCHGFPPATLSGTGLDHPQNTSCASCHPGTVTADHEIIEGGDHMNGKVDAAGGHDMPFVEQHTGAALAAIASCKACHGADYGGGTGEGAAPSCNACHESNVGVGFASWSTNCTFCHGGGTGRDATWTDDLAKAAPPQDVAGTGDQTRANAKVGAHQAHVTANMYSKPISCAKCHGSVPDSLAHLDGSTAVPAGYAGAGGSCAVQCHGGTAELGDKTSPAWTSTDGIGCGDCHTILPTSGLHELHRTGGRNVTCAKCHPGYVDGASLVNLDTHVNGVFNARIVANPSAGNPTLDAEFATTSVSWPAACAPCH